MAKAPTQTPTTVNFDFVKGSNFRVQHVDGAFMGGSPNGLTVAFYSERQPIPRRVVHELIDGFKVGTEFAEQRVVRDAIIRDVDVLVTMNLEVARNVQKTLGEIIQKVEEAHARAQEKTQRNRRPTQKT